MDQWREISAFPGRGPSGDFTLPYGPEITSIGFDRYSNLIWTGDSEGRIASFTGDTFSPYTKFRPRTDPTLQFISSPKGIISLGPSSVTLSHRRGLAKLNLKHESLTSLRCMALSKSSSSSVYAAGNGGRLCFVDLDRGTVACNRDYPHNVSKLSATNQHLVVGREDGKLDILDVRSPDLISVKTVAAHGGRLADLDARDTLVVTCGMARRNNDTYLRDPLVGLFDLRMLRPLPPLPFSAGPAFVRLHPKSPSHCAIASETGQLHMLDIVNQANVSLFHMSLTPDPLGPAGMPGLGSISPGSYLRSMEMSPSGEYLGFYDGFNVVHVWARDSAREMCDFGAPLDFPAPVTEEPPIAIDADVPLNSVGMPYYSETLLSAWPYNLKASGYQPVRPIDPQLLKSMKTVDFIGYAAYDPKKYGVRNQAINLEKYMRHKTRADETPRFKSQQKTVDRPTPDSEYAELSQAFFGDDLPLLEAGRPAGSSAGSSAGPPIPNSYRKLEILYSRFGVDDFDFDFYNRTAYSGLETHVETAYCNSLLQVYRFASPLFRYAIDELRDENLVERNLLAQLGYLFDMLQKGAGRPCRASNFQHVLSSLEPAKALRLVGAEADAEPDKTKLLHGFQRFLLNRLAQDAAAFRGTPVGFDNVCGYAVHSVGSCGGCRHTVERDSTAYVLDVGTLGGVYATGIAIGTEALPARIPPFEEYVSAALKRQTTTRGWCERCRKYQMQAQTREARSLPPVLACNVDLSSHELDLLHGTPWDGRGWFPVELSVAGSVAGQEAGQEAGQYELAGYVAEITGESGGPADRHLVAIVRVAGEDNLGKSEGSGSSSSSSFSSSSSSSSSQFYLFNDFLVKPISEAEALKTDVAWKVPAAVVYVRRGAARGLTISAEEIRARLDQSILYRDNLVAQHRENCRIDYELLTREEAPHPGTLVAIDAEFVCTRLEEAEIRSDGGKSILRPKKLALARVSVLRADRKAEETGKFAVPFIDDYIATDGPVVDYLTSFSGIEPGDLDPSTSRKSVVTLETAYRRLWLLLNLGCVFIGHGLGTDFRTINIMVPPSQVRDTADLFYLKEYKRKLSLKFLAYMLLDGEHIQTGNHDSIEDARAALLIYRRYLELIRSGEFEDVLDRIYNTGQALKYRPPVK